MAIEMGRAARALRVIRLDLADFARLEARIARQSAELRSEMAPMETRLVRWSFGSPVCRGRAARRGERRPPAPTRTSGNRQSSPSTPAS
jgi:hypothetical protein